MSALADEARRLAEQARSAMPAMAAAGQSAKNSALLKAAELLYHQRRAILAANNIDTKVAKRSGLAPAMIDRLSLNARRLEQMAESLRQVASLPDPVGQIIDGWTQPNGMRLRRMRTPLGVVLIIYESRPNVTVDAAALCLKSGNAVILRGGKESIRTNLALGKILGQAIAAAGLPSAAVQVVANVDRGLVTELLALSSHIDLVVPRGGKDLIKAVMAHSKMPVLKHLDGVCHVYIDASADLKLAEKIVWNAKMQRPGTCNAMETLLVHRAVAPKFLPAFMRKLRRAGVRIVADAAACRLGSGLELEIATEESWRTEYLDLVLNIAVVDDLDHAIHHINTYGSRHTDAIVTQSMTAARRFQMEVDSGSVMVNVSTRLADGFEYGLGAEIGISTDKLHARGPVGLEGLTTYKWLIEGEGQLRV